MSALVSSLSMSRHSICRQHKKCLFIYTKRRKKILLNQRVPYFAGKEN
jgi:hypothetical protein